MYASDCTHDRVPQARSPGAPVRDRSPAPWSIGGGPDENPSQAACPRDHCRPAGRRLRFEHAFGRPGRIRRHIGSGRVGARIRRGIRVAERGGRCPDPRARQGLCPELRRERDADVGALRRQQGDGRHPRLRLERGEPDQADQPELHRPHRDGGEDRPGRRLGRRPGPDGHGPDLCPAVRERRPAGRHHGPVEGLDGAG